MTVIHLLLGFEGRISRQGFWMGLAILAALEIAARAVLGIPFFPTATKPVSVRLTEAAIELLTLYPTTAVVVKRLHDRDQPGSYAVWLVGISVIIMITNLFGLTDDPDNPTWLDWVLSFCAIGIVLAYLVELGFRRGTRGDNRYGPDPLGAPTPGAHGPEST
jgi:uncharacterized membrane protein YhaH (DUF805 family)